MGSKCVLEQNNMWTAYKERCIAYMKRTACITYYVSRSVIASQNELT